MITAVFTDNSDYARATGLWQWDYGQRLRVEGLHLPTAVEIHFALTEQSGDSNTRVGTTKDGVTEVVIPDSLLENQAAGATYEIYAWIYLADKTSGETIKRISMQVKCRPKPEAFDAPEDAELFRDAIAQVNASADRAEAAREGAEAAQKAAEAAAGKIEGEITGAGEIAEQVKRDAAAVAKDKQAVSQMVTETAQNAQKAAESAQAAERSSTAAKEAQTAAESAKAGAEAAMEEVERDRIEVSGIRTAVEQMRDAVDTDRQAVAADRRAVENTALQFGQTAQNALDAVGQAQEAAVGAVSAEGQKQTTAVQQAGTQAVGDVGTAKTEAVKAVTTEGDTQTKRVQDAAAGIVADREQIAANKAEIATLHQGKADSIVETAQGETMTLTDSSDKLFEGLRVFGKSTQDGVPSLENPVPIVSAGEGGSIKVEVKSFPYEPYREPQPLTLATPNGFPGIPVTKDGNYTDSDGQQWICDEVDLGREKYVQRVGIESISGGWALKETPDRPGRFLQNLLSMRYADGGRPALCNIATWRSWGTGNGDGRYVFALSGHAVYLSPSSKMTADELNAKLNALQTPVVIVGQLAAPIERDLTPEELAAYASLHTNYPTTVISNDAGVHMEASYVADTGTYIRNMEARLSARLVNVQSALISQKISGGGIKVTDSSRVPVVRFAMWGKTEQVRTSGKNLIDVKGKTTISNGTFDISDSSIDCVLKDTWGGSYIMFEKEYPAGEYTFSADKIKNGAVQALAFLLSAEPSTHNADSCIFNGYYKGYLIKNGVNKLNRAITFKVDIPFTMGVTFQSLNDVIGEVLSIKNIQLERGTSATAYEPYSGGFPSPSPDWEQPIEITDQPVTVTVKGGAEQQSFTLIPPRPFTKWDRLEKVDGVWCWVYQHNEYTVTGDEDFTAPGDSYTKGSSTNCFVNGIKKASKNGNEIMNRLSRVAVVWSKPDAVGFSLNESQLHMRFPNTLLGVEDTATKEEKVAAYKAYVKAEYDKGTPYHVIYETLIPESIPLPPSEQEKLNALTMYAPETEITNTGGCNMELTYTVDTKSYVDSKIAAISAAVLEV